MSKFNFGVARAVKILIPTIFAQICLVIPGCAPKMSRVAVAGKSPLSRAATVDLSSPLATYKSFRLAIKANDDPAAKACWWISDDDRSGALDVTVGMDVALHRLAELRLRLRDRMTATICDGQVFTRRLEEAFRGMWRQWCKNRLTKGK